MTKVSIVIQSHLADAAIDAEYNPYMAKRRMMFVQMLQAKYSEHDRIADDELETLWYHFDINQPNK